MTVVLAGAAGAQTNTMCMINGQWVYCHSSSGGLSDPYAGQAAAAQQNFYQSQQNQQAQYYANMRALAAAKQAREQAEAAQDQVAEQTWVEEQRQLRAQNAGKLVAANKCDEAKAYALNEGDFELANQVAKACTPPNPGARP